MRTLKTSEAAALLNVSPNTLRTWERRFGYRVRATAGPLPVALFRRARVRTTATLILPDGPLAAHRQLLALVDDGHSDRHPAVARLSLIDDVALREAQA